MNSINYQRIKNCTHYTKCTKYTQITYTHSIHIVAYSGSISPERISLIPTPAQAADRPQATSRAGPLTKPSFIA